MLIFKSCSYWGLHQLYLSDFHFDREFKLQHSRPTGPTIAMNHNEVAEKLQPNNMHSLATPLVHNLNMQPTVSIYRKWTQRGCDLLRCMMWDPECVDVIYSPFNLYFIPLYSLHGFSSLCHQPNPHVLSSFIPSFHTSQFTRRPHHLHLHHHHNTTHLPPPAPGSLNNTLRPHARMRAQTVSEAACLGPRVGAGAGAHLQTCARGAVGEDLTCFSSWFTSSLHTRVSV